MRKLIKKNFIFGYILLLFLLINGVLLAENRIEIPDNTISRHQDTFVPILGKVEDGKLSLAIEFDAMQLNIKDVMGGDDYVIQELEVFNYQDGDDLNKRVLHITSNNTKIENDTLCFLKVRALVTDTNIFKITPISIAVNEINIEDATFTEGYLSLPDDEKPIKEVEKADIGLFYPNPIFFESILEFTIFEEPAKVEIFIFNASGEKICSVPDDYDFTEFYLTDEAGYMSCLDAPEFNPGRYKIHFTPLYKNWAQGAYFALIKIGDNTFRTNFIIRY